MQERYTHERYRAMRITQRESAANRKSFKFLIRKSRGRARNARIVRTWNDSFRVANKVRGCAEFPRRNLHRGTRSESQITIRRIDLPRIDSFRSSGKLRERNVVSRNVKNAFTIIRLCVHFRIKRKRKKNHWLSFPCTAIIYICMTVCTSTRNVT